MSSLPSEKELYTHSLKILEEKKRKCGDDSAQWRDYGNRYYRMATNISKTDNDRMLDLAVAKLFYDRAEQNSKNYIELSSAIKNQGTVNWKISIIVLKSEYRWDFVLKTCSDMVVAFDRARQYGSASQNDTWLDVLEKTRRDALEELWDVAAVINSKNHFQALVETVALKMDKCGLKCDWLFKLADFSFKRSIFALENKHFKEALSDLRECYRPIEEAKSTIEYLKFDDTNQHAAEVRVLEQDVQFQTYHAESLQALDKGEQLLHIATNDSEFLNMDMAWDAVDSFRLSVILTRDNDVEVEAIAMSKLGTTYNDIFKRKDKALPYFKQCIELAHSLHPRTFNDKDWFQKATQTLEKFQGERAKEEDKKWENVRAKHISKVKDQIDQLNKEYQKIINVNHEDKDKTFLVFLYKEWPPKHIKRSFEPPTMKSKSLAKTLYRDATTHYHPDLVNVDEHTVEWKILVEEIAKCVNAKYTMYK